MLVSQFVENLTFDEIEARRQRPTIPVPKGDLSDAALMADYEQRKKEREHEKEER